jgi:hypothetical protein
MSSRRGARPDLYIPIWEYVKRRPLFVIALSRLGLPARLISMGGTFSPSSRWLTAAVLLHLAISFVHGAAHAGADVPLSPAANLFVYIVILAGPILGLALTRLAWRIGNWVIAITMAASLVFGVVNHFLLASPDHVSHVAQQWRTLFATTAVLLALTEAVGSILAIRLARERTHVS